MGTRLPRAASSRRVGLFVFGVLVFGVPAAGALSGCSGGQPGPAGTVRATTSPLTGPSGQPVLSPSPAVTAGGPSPSGPVLPTGTAQPPRPTRPAKPPPTLGQQTLTGQVEEGVERGCLILRDSTGSYQLLGGDPAIVRVGATVSVTGQVVTGVKSFCMQGRPFQVTEAHRI